MNAAWAILTWKHWAWATAIGVLIGLLVPLQILHLNFFWTPWKIAYHTPWYVAFAYVFLIAIAVVESSVPRSRAAPMGRYVAGAVAAGMVCIGLAWSFSDLLPMPPKRVVAGEWIVRDKEYKPQQKGSIAVFAIGFDGVLHCALAMFIYVRLRNSRLAAQALANAEVERSEANRKLLASQLQAAHAEVDPEVVFQRLEAIERIYEQDPARAEGLLDELTAFLRAAIPRVRSDEMAGSPL